MNLASLLYEYAPAFRILTLAHSQLSGNEISLPAANEWAQQSCAGDDSEAAAGAAALK